MKSNADPKFLKLVMWSMYRIKKKKKSNNIFAWFSYAPGLQQLIKLVKFKLCLVKTYIF